jgi:glycosyltransferase involved in cell wall biosynthesis
MKMFARSLLSLGHSVAAFCPKPHELQAWIKAECPQQSDRFYAYSFCESAAFELPVPFMTQILRAVRHWKDLAAAVNRYSLQQGTHPTLVFITWLDSYLTSFFPVSLLDRIFRFQWSGLLFHPLHLRMDQSRLLLRRGIFDYDNFLSSVHCRSIAVLDEGVAAGLQRKSGARPVVVFPDVADFAAPDQTFKILKGIKEKADGRRIVGLIGSLEKRKGLLTLLNLAQNTQQGNWFYIFCGKFYEDGFTPAERRRIDQVVDSLSANCYFHFEYIPNAAQFNALIDLCDVLFAVYENFYHSSNILTLAAHFRKMIVVSKGYCMHDRVSRFQLGLSVDAGDLAQCYSALHILLNHQADLHPDFEGFLEHHSEKRLAEAFEAVMASL